MDSEAANALNSPPGTPPPAPPTAQSPVRPRWAETDERVRLIARLRERKLARSQSRVPPWMRSVQKRLPHPHSIRDTWIGRLLGKSIMRRACWCFKPHNAALGLGIGMFVSWTPTIGAQMALSATLCCLLGGNIALGVVGVWFSNPVFYAADLYVGLWVLGLEWPAGAFADKSLGEVIEVLLSDFIYPISVGSVILGLPAGAMTYFSAYGFGHWQRRHHLVRTIKERNALRRERRRKRLAERHARKGKSKSRLSQATAIARKTVANAATSSAAIVKSVLTHNSSKEMKAVETDEEDDSSQDASADSPPGQPPDQENPSRPEAPPRRE